MRSKLILVTTIFYVLAITALSLIKIADIETPRLDIGNITILDKFVHIGFYFVFNFLVLLFCVSRSPELRLVSMVIVSLSVILYGCLIELAQYHIGRECSVYDVVANSLGVVAALIAFRSRGGRARD